MKTCSKCGVLKEETEFYKHHGMLDGLQYYCRPCSKMASRMSRKANLEDRRKSDREAKQAERDLNPGKVREYRLAHLEAAREADRKWKRNNKAVMRERNKRRYQTDSEYRLLLILRARQYEEIHRVGAKKSASTKILTGCSQEELWGHLEALFKPGMTRENHGPLWEIDHIKPCAAFDLADPEQQKACFHWTNLQPLFKEENRKKSDTFPLTS